MPIVATTQGLPAGKVQSPQWPSVQPSCASLPCLPRQGLPTALAADCRLEGLLLRWQVTEETWKGGRSVWQPREHTRVGDSAPVVELIRMSREGGGQEGPPKGGTPEEWGGPRAGVPSSEGPRLPAQVPGAHWRDSKARLLGVCSPREVRQLGSDQAGTRSHIGQMPGPQRWGRGVTSGWGNPAHSSSPVC